MAVIVGTAGAINGLAGIANWTITPNQQMAQAIASNTSAGPHKVGGNKDWMLKGRAYGKVPPVLPGAAVSFIGWTGTGGNRWTASAVCESVRLNCPIAQGAPLSWDITLGGNGQLSRASGAAVTDASTPVIVSASPCKVSWGGSDMAKVQGYSFELSVGLKTYADGGYIKRLSNSIYAASFNVDQLEGDPTLAIVEGDFQVVNFYVDATTYWQFSYGVVEECEQDVPIETGDIVPYRVRGSWSGWKIITGTSTKGTIIKPDTTVLW